MNEPGQTTVLAASAVPAKAEGWRVDLSPASLAASQDHCQALTRHRARNFYYGLRLTPPAQRSSMFAIYAWMRAADDIADRHGDMREKQRDLADFQLLTHALHAGRLTGEEPLDDLARQPLWPAVAHTFHDHRLPVDTLDEMITGQLLDQVKTRYTNFDELYDYCFKVASTVGLTCVRLWGFEGDDDTLRLAEQRGIGLQLTNILRDLVEDARRDRIYLPHDELARFGLDEATFLQIVLHSQPDERFDELMGFQIRRARAYYQLSAELESRLTPACRSMSWALMKIYHGLLEKIAADPRAMLHRRIRLSSLHKVGIAVAALIRSYDDSEPSRPSPPPRPARPQRRSTHRRPAGAPPSGKTALVLGGGLAGLSAAIRLAEAGVGVTIVETRKRLGGRATSFIDPETHQVLDNCQHVLLGCCTNLLDFYRRLGVDHLIQWHRRFHFLDGQGHLDVLEADDVAAPLHLTRAMMSFSSLSLMEKLAIAQGMRAVMRSDPRKWADRSFTQWLLAHGQPAGAIEKFWGPVVIGAVNQTMERASARYALEVFRLGFLAHADAFVMGLSSVPLVRLYDAAEHAIEAAGGRLMLATSAASLRYEGGRITGVMLEDQQPFTADAYVSALPYDRLAKLCPPELVANDARLKHLDKLEPSPIIGIHLEMAHPDGQPVLDLPHVVLTQSPLQWVFSKGCRLVDPDDRQPAETAPRIQYLHAVISAAHDWVDKSAEEILAMARTELARAFPRAEEASLIHGRVVKEKRATFSASPGSDLYRPAAAGSTPNLFLAGDWCDTGWPATMEGAVRSGYLAATAATAALGVKTPAGTDKALVPDLPPAALYKWLAGV